MELAQLVVDMRECGYPVRVKRRRDKGAGGGVQGLVEIAAAQLCALVAEAAAGTSWVQRSDCCLPSTILSIASCWDLVLCCSSGQLLPCTHQQY